MSRRRLQQATSIHGHNQGATYIDAHVLLMTWGSPDVDGPADLAALQRCFSSHYNFETETRSISKPTHIHRHVSRFIRNKARPAHLLVVYYNAPPQAAPCDDLGRLRSLFETSGCDVLLIWDCNQRAPWESNLVWDSETSTRGTVGEVLTPDILHPDQRAMSTAAGGDDSSFIVALSDSLAEAAAAGDSISVASLRSHIARMRQRRRDDDFPQVVLGSPTHDNSPPSCRSIVLTRLPPRDEAQVTLCLSLRSDNETSEWARWIDSIGDESLERQNSVTISGFGNGQTPALALVAVPISKWQRILESPSPSTALVGFEIIGGTDAIAHPMSNIIEDHLASRLETDSPYPGPFSPDVEPSTATTVGPSPTRSKRGYPEFADGVDGEGYSLREQPKRTRKALPTGRKLLPIERSTIVSPISPSDDDAAIIAEQHRKALPSARTWRPESSLTSPLSPSKQGLFCSECNSMENKSSPNRIWFKDDETLAAHIRKMHTRPFQCVFCWAGCESKFASKNEWKRHVMSQHILLHFWICQEGACAKIVNVNVGVDGRFSHGSIFNRKDLYTQHLRRMHQSAAVKKLHKQAKIQGKLPAGAAVTEFNDWVHDMQQKAQIERCRLPDYMVCPAEGCALDFHGPKAFDDRMEHVAKHLERAALGREPPVSFGGQDDPTLTEWATRPEVGIAKRRGSGWQQDNPLKPGVADAAGGGGGSAEGADGLDGTG